MGDAKHSACLALTYRAQRTDGCSLACVIYASVKHGRKGWPICTGRHVCVTHRSTLQHADVGLKAAAGAAAQLCSKVRATFYAYSICL